MESLSSPVGWCTKCLMTQRMEKCSDQVHMYVVCAKLMVESEGESKAIVQGHAFGQILIEMAGGKGHHH